MENAAEGTQTWYVEGEYLTDKYAMHIDATNILTAILSAVSQIAGVDSGQDARALASIHTVTLCDSD